MAAHPFKIPKHVISILSSFEDAMCPVFSLPNTESKIWRKTRSPGLEIWRVKVSNSCTNTILTASTETMLRRTWITTSSKQMMWGKWLISSLILPSPNRTVTDSIILCSIAYYLQRWRERLKQWRMVRILWTTKSGLTVSAKQLCSNWTQVCSRNPEMCPQKGCEQQLGMVITQTNVQPIQTWWMETGTKGTVSQPN